MNENHAAERGQLSPGEWATLYAGSNPKTFYVGLSGSIPSNAKVDVEVNGNIEGTLTQKNSNMHANGTKIRVHNVGKQNQGYNYYPV